MKKTHATFRRLFKCLNFSKKRKEKRKEETMPSLNPTHELTPKP